MSILKGILHHWNKTTQSYDTIHPETEVSQVTDWNQGIVNTLASTGLSSLVNTLTSDSLLATMIQKVLTATGVKYSMGQNGYICFGSLFGGIIIQWGYSLYGYVAFPIRFTSFRQIILLHAGKNFMIAKALEDDSLAGFTLSVKNLSGTGIDEVDQESFYDAHYIAIGK